MSYIRDRHEERTGYQESVPYYGNIDVQCDFVMVYGVNESTAEHVAEFRRRGYVVHLMAGISWGNYVDYIFGKWDGREHWDEAQTDRYGNLILHGQNTPYMVPTVTFADYITERLKTAVDAGVEAIHVEEPEFWDRGGYSPAFQREYELYYREKWVSAHSSVDARYKTARLKAYLYRRTIDRVSSALKEYAMIKYGRELRFYVPTHSLLNYTQWKIVSPEGLLADIPSVDGCIAQVWTGTSREKNWLDGVFAERTFETAYLEYGVMQELVKGTGRRMWFLHDPIEDNPIFDWDDYRTNYLKTVTASLLHPKINTFEICPWPRRVFDGKYPKDSPDAEPISDEYRTLLNSVFQTLGDVECADSVHSPRVGVVISDSALYQRGFPDDVLAEVNPGAGTVLHESEDECREFERKLFVSDGEDRELMLKFIKTNALPSFYGLCMPLLKYGMPVRPVLLDNVRRYNGYLDDYDVLVMSYEFIKPEFPDVNNALAAWVRNGGQLIYVGDGSDPYHIVSAWWSGAYKNPAEHLFAMLGIEPKGGKEFFAVGGGTVAVWDRNPAKLCFSKENAEEFREFFRKSLAQKEREWKYSNSIIERRGTYIAAAAFDESVSDEPLVLEGNFADMYSVDYDIITRKEITPGENTLLYNLNKLEGDSPRIIGTSARVLAMDETDGGLKLTVHGAPNVLARTRIRVPSAVRSAECADTSVEFSYDAASRTALLTYKGLERDTEIGLKY